MRNLRVLCILAAVTVALIGLSAVPTSAQDLCPYDVSGDYTYHPGETPNYLFFGDGQITYDQSIIWYLDDVLACYNTYSTVPSSSGCFPQIPAA